MGMSLKILFVGYFKYNSGSSHALLGYVRAARCLGYDLRASRFGVIDEAIQKIVPVAEKSWVPDIIVLVFESKQFLSESDIEEIEKLTKHCHTVIIDPDGKNSDVVKIGLDTNHPTTESQVFWKTFYNRFSDIILQPSISISTTNSKKFLYFGIDIHRSHNQERNEKRRFDLLYVGNNWYRWQDFVWLFKHLEPIRSKIGRIAVYGKHWFGDPKQGLEQFTFSDPAFLRVHNIESYPSVPFDEVETVMGQGKLHPIFIRPILNTLEFVTPRMFETFAADTVPILPPYFTHAVHLYGKQVLPLYLTENPADIVITMLEKYPDYLSLVQEIRTNLIKEHTYEVRLSELLGFCF
jgi:hypothetical protein